MTSSSVLFENGNYSACFMRDNSLIVQNKRTGKGYRMIGENAAIWADNIKNAIDKSEANLLCKVICQ